MNTCKVYDGVKDWDGYDNRQSYQYNDNEVDMLSAYGYIIEIDAGRIEIKDAERYTRRKA